MRIPLQIAFHGIDHSDAIEQNIRGEVAKIESLCDRVTACRVAVEAHHNVAAVRRPPFHIRIDLTMPGTELVVTNDPKDGHPHDDLPAALRRAFAAMERRLKNYMKKHRDQAAWSKPPAFDEGV